MDTCLRRREAGAMRETIPAWVWMTNDNLNIEPGSQRDVPNKITVGASHDCQIFHVDQSRPQGASSVTSQHYAGNRAPARLSLLMCIPADWHMDSHGFYPSPPACDTSDIAPSRPLMAHYNAEHPRPLSTNDLTWGPGGDVSIRGHMTAPGAGGETRVLMNIGATGWAEPRGAH